MSYWLAAYLIGVAVHTIIIHGMAQNPNCSRKATSTSMAWVVLGWPVCMVLHPFAKKD